MNCNPSLRRGVSLLSTVDLNEPRADVPRGTLEVAEPATVKLPGECAYCAGAG